MIEFLRQLWIKIGFKLLKVTYISYGDEHCSMLLILDDKKIVHTEMEIKKL